MAGAETPRINCRSINIYSIGTKIFFLKNAVKNPDIVVIKRL